MEVVQLYNMQGESHWATCGAFVLDNAASVLSDEEGWQSLSTRMHGVVRVGGNQVTKWVPDVFHNPTRGEEFVSLAIIHLVALQPTG